MIDPKKIKSQLCRALTAFWELQKREATDLIEYELHELENLFALLVYSPFIGLPLPPSSVAYELLPYMESELKALLVRSTRASDMLSDIASVFDGL
ncbi:MAG: hypothetical protein JW928_04735 [Candidatus Aureabacteria bacterium]|nr:hypothetical protein [Candidatus Auribacterota bacterium]